MASVDTGGGGKEKGKQKKITLRVDFTPMVDMNMLLITFFMFCTSLSKPQTMEINMPSKDKPVDGGTKIGASRAVTIILGGNDKLYYYLGELDENAYKNPDFLVETDYSDKGLRTLLLQKNARIHNEINELKLKKLNNEISEEEFKRQSIEIKKDEKNKDAAESVKAPVVMIKAMEEATYKNLIDVLDEMQICSIGVYAIVDLSDGDKFLVENKESGGALINSLSQN